MTTISNIMPPDLAACFDSLAYEESSGLVAHSVEWLPNECIFKFSLYFGDYEQNEIQNWQLQVKGCRDSKIDLVNLGGYFEFYSEHVLLSEYTDSRTELYFKNQTDNPKQLLADLYIAHNTLFGNLVPVEKYLNGENMLGICNSNHGLFAKGPKSILSHYFECLAKAGKEPYFFGDFAIKKWDEKKWIEEDKDLKLALLGGTYFVGSEFIFERVR